MNRRVLAVLVVAILLVGSAALVASGVGDSRYPRALKRAVGERGEYPDNMVESRSELNVHTRWKTPAESRHMSPLMKTAHTAAWNQGRSLSPQPDTLRYDSWRYPRNWLYFGGDVWGDVWFTCYYESLEVRSVYVWLQSDAGGLTTCTLYVSPDTLGQGDYDGCHLPDIANSYFDTVITDVETNYAWLQVDIPSLKFYGGDHFHVTAGVSDTSDGAGWYLTVDTDGSEVFRSMLADPSLDDTTWSCGMPYDLILRVGGQFGGQVADLNVVTISSDLDLFFQDSGATVQLEAVVTNTGTRTFAAGDYDISFAVKDTSGTVVPLGTFVGTQGIGPGDTVTVSAPSTWTASPPGEYVAYAYLSSSDPIDVIGWNDTAAISQQPFTATHLDYTDVFEHPLYSIHFVGGAKVAMKYATHCEAAMIDSIGFATSFSRAGYFSEWIHLYVWEGDKDDTTYFNLLWHDSTYQTCHSDTNYYFVVDMSTDSVKVNAPTFLVGMGAFEHWLGPNYNWIEPKYEHAPKLACPDGPRDAKNPDMHPIAWINYESSGNWSSDQSDWVVYAYARCVPPADYEVTPIRIDFPTNANWLRPCSLRTVMATVANHGAQTVSFDVTADDAQGWSGSAAVANLLPGDTRTVSFTPDWHPDTVLTDYRFTVITQLAGDEFPQNDTLVGTIIRATYRDSCYLWLDDGVDTLVWIGGSVWYLSAGTWWGNEFMASECPFESLVVSHVEVWTGTYLTTEPTDSGFPDHFVDPFEISIWKEVGGDTQMVSMDTIIGNMDSSGVVYWIPNPPPLILHDEHFWVLMSNVVDSRGNESVCYDTILNHPTRQWAYHPDLGWWNPVSVGDTFPDWNIRAWLDPAPAPEFACGDANADGFINFADALYIKNYYYQTPPGSPPPIGQGDVNLDGYVTFGDALYIKDYYYQTPPGSPPPCEPPPVGLRQETEHE